MTDKRLTDAELKALREILEAATPEIWMWHESGDRMRLISTYRDEDILFAHNGSIRWSTVNDAMLIAHARAYLTALLTEVDALRAELDTLRNSKDADWMLREVDASRAAEASLKGEVVELRQENGQLRKLLADALYAIAMNVAMGINVPWRYSDKLHKRAKQLGVTTSEDEGEAYDARTGTGPAVNTPPKDES